MANRRMFSKTIVFSSRFLRMPDTSRLLYYDLGMQADDDGYCEWFPVLQMTGGKQQDLEVLQANEFIKIFNNEVLLIKDWKENNYLRNDRYQPSKFLNIYTMDTIGIPAVDHPDTQVRLGKDRKDKDRLKQTTVADSGELGKDDQIGKLIFKFQHVNPSYQLLFKRNNQRDALNRMIAKHGYEQVEKLIDHLPNVIYEPYAPKITTPCQLEEQLGRLLAFVRSAGATQQSKKGGRYVPTTE